MAPTSGAEATPAPAVAATPDIRSTKPGRKRLLITVITLLSFIIGTPFWYKSTQVYRAPLPFEDIDAFSNWASSNSLELRCQLHVILASGGETSFTKVHLNSVVSKIHQHIHSFKERSPSDKQSCQAGFEVLVTGDAPNSCLRSQEVEGNAAWPCGLASASLLKTLYLSSDDDGDEILLEFSKRRFDSKSLKNASDTAHDGGVYTVVVLQKEKVDGSRKEGFHFRTVLGKYRHAWISGGFSSDELEDDVVIRIGDLAVNFFGGAKIGSGDNKGTKMPLSADGEAILSFSLLNADPGDWIFDWNFEDLEARFLRPVVESLRRSAQLRVESQVLYYTPKAVQSHWVPTLNAHIVEAKQLPFFLNANEWHLDSSSAAAGRSKILHFAIYVPAANEWPLQFQLENGQLSSTNAFTSPEWGGIAVWNPVRSSAPVSIGDKPKVTTLTTKDFEPLAGVFVAQLRSLFGLPASIVEDNNTGVFRLPATTTGFAEWERDVLLRRQSIDNMAASATTLTSLSRLVHKLPNMLIMDEIGDQVKSSLRAAGDARFFAAEGTYGATAEAARTTKSLAEAAFFHPSIMSLLYNPAEHHLAIYTPFFVPVLLHAVLAVVKEVSRYRREWKRFKQKQH
ncbi:unnamed protein product [Calypogeia fissa]